MQCGRVQDDLYRNGVVQLQKSQRDLAIVQRLGRFLGPLLRRARFDVPSVRRSRLSSLPASSSYLPPQKRKKNRQPRCHLYPAIRDLSSNVRRDVTKTNTAWKEVAEVRGFCLVPTYLIRVKLVRFGSCINRYCCLRTGHAHKRQR